MKNGDFTRERAVTVFCFVGLLADHLKIAVCAVLIDCGEVEVIDCGYIGFAACVNPHKILVVITLAVVFIPLDRRAAGVFDLHGQCVTVRLGGKIADENGVAFCFDQADTAVSLDEYHAAFAAEIYGDVFAGCKFSVYFGWSVHCVSLRLRFSE